MALWLTVPFPPGQGAPGSLCPRDPTVGHVLAAVAGVPELRGVLVALHEHGVRTLHVRRVAVEVFARDFDRRRAVAKRARGGLCRALPSKGWR